MSRIGKQPVALPAGVKVSKTGTKVNVEGPKGKISFDFHPDMTILVDEKAKVVRVERPKDPSQKDGFSSEKKHRELHGLTRALIQNMVKGVCDPYEKKLEISGVGYQGKIEGKFLVLNVGFAHPVKLSIPAGLTVECPKPTEIFIRGVDKQLVGEFTARARKVRPPEPYNAKGIKYGKAKDCPEEIVKRKAGKAFGSGEK
jgi:large subunit ribosomal protein L6